MAESLLSHFEAGEGIPVVFIHGFCENKEIWRDFVQPLSQKARVIVIDLPGFGDNPELTAPVTVADFAEAIFHFLQQKGVERCIMIGHSLGGYVALAFAEKFPQRLRGLGLFHSTAYPDTIEKKQGRDKTIDFIERYGADEFVNEFIPPLFSEGKRFEEKETINWLIDMAKKTAKSTIIESIRAMRDRKDRSKVLEKMAQPVLFISGKNDIALNFQTGFHQFSLPANAVVHIMSNVGHMGMFERQKETHLIVSQFIDLVNTSY